MAADAVQSQEGQPDTHGSDAEAVAARPPSAPRRPGSARPPPWRGANARAPNDGAAMTAMQRFEARWRDRLRDDSPARPRPPSAERLQRLATVPVSRTEFQERALRHEYDTLRRRAELLRHSDGHAPQAAQRRPQPPPSATSADERERAVERLAVLDVKARAGRLEQRRAEIDRQKRPQSALTVKRLGEAAIDEMVSRVFATATSKHRRAVEAARKSWTTVFIPRPQRTLGRAEERDVAERLCDGGSAVRRQHLQDVRWAMVRDVLVRKHALVAGVVTDVISGVPLEGVTISATSGVGDFETRTDAKGRYAIELPAGAKCHARLFLYESRRFTRPAGPVECAAFDIALQPLSGALGGTVCDGTSSQRRPVAGATVKCGSQTTTTDARGMWAVSGLPPGTYTVEVAHGSFFNYKFDATVREASSVNAKEPLPKGVTGGGGVVVPEVFACPRLGEHDLYRCILRWNATPRDLDLYLECHGDVRQRVVFYGAKRIAGVGAELDSDVRDGFGPETMTIRSRDQRFSLYVHNCSGDAPWEAAGAKVDIYARSGFLQTVTLDPDMGMPGSEYWHVLDVNHSKLTVVNRLSSVGPATSG